MKKILITLLISFPVISFAQNVGIGTTSPVEKLEVKNSLRSTLKISSNNFTDTTQLLLSNRTAGNSGTDFSFKNIREEGLFVSSLSDLPQNTSANSLVITPGGNVGVGIIPASKFHVNGNSLFTGTMDANGSMRLQGLNLFEFGAGVAGKEVNAGKIGYNAFGQNALTFVGAGTNATNRAFYFFGEGGTTFSGPATITGNTNIGGQLQVNGNPGTVGQVLTSNGTSDPSWANAAYGNNTRFALSFSHSVTTGHSLAPLTTIYNLNPANITIGANSFTFNKTGLYHFDIYLNSAMSIPGSVGFLNFYFSGGPIDFLQDEPVLPYSFIGQLNRHFQFEMHITTGTTLSFGSYVAVATSGTNTGRVYCHLIND